MKPKNQRDADYKAADKDFLDASRDLLLARMKRNNMVVLASWDSRIIPESEMTAANLEIATAERRLAIARERLVEAGKKLNSR